MTYRVKSPSRTCAPSPGKALVHARRDEKGELVFVRATIVLDGGAYASSSPRSVANAACLEPGRIAFPTRGFTRSRIHQQPADRRDGGFGAVQSCFAYEARWTSCRGAGHRSSPIRERNALRNGDASSRATGGGERARRGCHPSLRGHRDANAKYPLNPSRFRRAGQPNARRRGTTRRRLRRRMKNVCYSHASTISRRPRATGARRRGPIAHVTPQPARWQDRDRLRADPRTELGVERVRVDRPDTTSARPDPHPRRGRHG